MKFNTYNRPISPHLTIYSPQFSSVLSIWHRITGVSLSFLVFICVLTLKLSTFFVINNSVIINYFLISLIILINIMFLYHSLNGLRHVVWDLGFLLDIKSLNVTSLALILFILLALLHFLKELI